MNNLDFAESAIRLANACYKQALNCPKTEAAIAIRIGQQYERDALVFLRKMDASC